MHSALTLPCELGLAGSELCEPWLAGSVLSLAALASRLRVSTDPAYGMNLSSLSSFGQRPGQVTGPLPRKRRDRRQQPSLPSALLHLR